MTEAATELDLTVIEELDFAPACDIDGHGTDDLCDHGPAVWIAEATHECMKQTRLICDGFKNTMESFSDVDYMCNACDTDLDFEEVFKVIGKI